MGQSRNEVKVRVNHLNVIFNEELDAISIMGYLVIIERLTS